MRTSNVLVLLTAITLAPATALAQSPSPGAGSCTGDIAGSVGLAIADSTGTMQSIASHALPYVFGAAERQCGTSDIDLQVKLTTALPIGSVGTVEVWVGPSCDTYTQRTTGTPIPCQKIAVLDIADFTTSSTVSADGIYVPIPSGALFSPNVSPPNCTEQVLGNEVYLFIYTDPSMPTSACILPLIEQNQGPPSVLNIAAAPDASGSPTSGVTVSWELPPATSFGQSGYALLCADADGNPETSLSTTTPVPYSQCINGKIDRRALPGDGTQTIAAMATAPNGTLATLDPRFFCGLYGPTTTSATLALDPTKAHQFVVATFDNFGNVTGTAPVTSVAGPATTGSDMGGGTTTKSHGCAIGGAAASSPWALAFVMLALGAIVVRASSRRRL